MRKLMRRRPRPAMIVAVIALVLALGGTAVAAKKLGLGALSPKAKQKTVGVGKLTYVSTTTTIPDDGDPHGVSANCPAGQYPLGGGVRLAPKDDNYWWGDGYLTPSGFAATVFNFHTDPGTATVTVACGVSQAVTGAPPS